jgi:hypothetical protein
MQEYPLLLFCLHYPFQAPVYLPVKLDIELFPISHAFPGRLLSLPQITGCPDRPSSPIIDLLSVYPV